MRRFLSVLATAAMVAMAPVATSHNDMPQHAPSTQDTEHNVCGACWPIGK